MPAKRAMITTKESKESTNKEPVVGRDQMRKLADLSKLSLSPREEERLGGELTAILEYFAIIDSATMTTTKHQASAGSGQTGEDLLELRLDVVKPSSPEQVLAGVPSKKGRFVKAPRVF